MSFAGRPFAPLLAVLLVGCSIECTLIGCTTGLNVTLTMPPTGAFTVSILEGGVEVPEKSVTCGHWFSCQTIFFANYTGANPTIRVTTSAGTKDTPFSSVSYQPLYPNGKKCGAACAHGNVVAVTP